MGRSIETSTIIAAPGSRVWAILMDFTRYPEWNPFIRSIKGNVRIGEILEVVIQPPGRKANTFRPVIVEVEPERRFRWRGSLLIRGLFVGEHRFEIDVQGGVVCFSQSEGFTGLLVPLVGSVLSATELGFRAMNEALKVRAEGR